MAMRDRIHQPYRAPLCSMLPLLLPLAGEHHILGVALSGAGPSVLVITGSQDRVPGALAAIRKALEGMPEPEIKICCFEPLGASHSYETALRDL